MVGAGQEEVQAAACWGRDGYHAVAREHDKDEGFERQNALLVCSGREGAGGERWGLTRQCCKQKNRCGATRWLHALRVEFVVQVREENVALEVLAVLERVVPVPARAAALIS